MDLQLQKSYGAFINNELQLLLGPSFPAINAATGQHLAEIARCGQKEIDAAVCAAEVAFPAWKALGFEERARMLHRFADLIEVDAERLAQIDARDIGRRLFETRIDQVIAVRHFRYFASVILAHEDFGRPIQGGHLVAKREPLGVCGQIIPWNAPAIMVAMKLAPALAAGNTVVLKPDENASLSTLELARHIAAVLPPGVVNIVPGLGVEAGAALTAHPKVRKLAFTGSTETGRIVGGAAAERLIPATLELGGKSPNIVFPDIESIDEVVDNVTFGSIFANGQACFAGTRLFLHSDIYDVFLEKLVASFGRAKVGDPLVESTIVSCLVTPEQGKRVLNYLDIGRDEGARLVCGGRRVTVSGNEYGYFIEPTILEVKNDMRVAQDEIFGPVLSVIKWNNYESMLAEANDSRYGLAAGIYSSGLHNALNAADRLNAGSIWINRFFNLVEGSPYGGYNDSGLGREFCRDTLNAYSQLKSITVQTSTDAAWFVPKV
ncbi:aldehyde dehydrogenase family protein [Paraburkholderia sediminicola]|uniref:aldehyde dehydrogenase family protein n=1 Tax=Paraburkholderia sediminicola TaxID=458836 RepID=UPI0038BA696B